MSLHFQIPGSYFLYIGGQTQVDLLHLHIAQAKHDIQLCFDNSQQYFFHLFELLIIVTIDMDHYFFLGDNRDCSKDSRYLTSVGYVHKDNLVGKAQFIFFSSDKRIGSFIEFWKWHKSIRFNRTFNKIN